MGVAGVKGQFLGDYTCTRNSLYISHAVSYVYVTEYEIWAGFEPVGSTENFGLSCKFLRAFFLMFSWPFFFQKYFSVCTKKLHNIKGEKTINFCLKF